MGILHSLVYTFCSNPGAGKQANTPSQTGKVKTTFRHFWRMPKNG